MFQPFKWHFRLFSSPFGHLDCCTFYGRQLKVWPNEWQLIEDTSCAAWENLDELCTLRRINHIITMSICWWSYFGVGIDTSTENLLFQGYRTIHCWPPSGRTNLQIQKVWMGPTKATKPEKGAGRYCESSVVRRLQIIETSWYHEYFLWRFPIFCTSVKWISFSETL